MKKLILAMALIGFMAAGCQPQAKPEDGSSKPAVTGKMVEPPPVEYSEK